MIFLFIPFTILILLFHQPSYANGAFLSFTMAKDSAGIAAGGNIKGGFALVGISSTFTTDAPWSYVETTKNLTGPCETFKADSSKDCEPKGTFHDGDEWEIFTKIGIQMPFWQRLYIDAGLGLSHQKLAKLFIFCVGITSGGNCDSAKSFETWGQIKELFFITYLGGISLRVSPRVLLHLDYHSRQGFQGGFMWVFKP